MAKEESFSILIKTKRKEKKLTAEQLANQVGVDRTYISKIENKGIFPSLEVYARIAEVLDIKLSDFNANKYITTPDEFLTDLRKAFDIEGGVAKTRKKLESKRLSNISTEEKLNQSSTLPASEIIKWDITCILRDEQTNKYKKYVSLLLDKYNPSQKDNKKLKWVLVKILKQLWQEEQQHRRRLSKERQRFTNYIFNPAQYEQSFNKLSEE